MTNAELSSDQVLRADIQRLEDLRRAGVTHWKHIAPIPSPAQATESRPSSALSSQTPSIAAIAHAPIAESKSQISQTKPLSNTNLFGESTSSEVPKKKTTPPLTTPAPGAEFQPLDLPLAERVSGLAALAERVRQCTRCQELASTRTQTVFGVGNPQAKILFVGEAPGADEDAQGEPFVGRSGQLLNDIIKACRIRR